MSNSKQEIRKLFANNYRDWYKLSETEKEQKPYYLVKRVRGREEPIDSLKGITIKALSEKQARYFFLERYPWLQDYTEVFGERVEFIARLDEEAYQMQQEEKARVKRVQETQDRDREDMIQNAWWQD